MIGQISPELLQDNYIEKDMKKGVLFYLGNLLKKVAKQQYGNSFLQSLSNRNEQDEKLELEDPTAEDMEEYDLNTRGLSISIFRKNLRKLVRIISGIVATFLVVISIIIILFKKHKSGFKLLKKKIQVIY